MIARMWEVRGIPERIDELVDWVCAVALPAVEAEPGHVRDEVYASADRVVVISSWRGTAVDLPDPPPELVARPPHAWDFNLIDRHTELGR